MKRIPLNKLSFYSLIIILIGCISLLILQREYYSDLEKELKIERKNQNKLHSKFSSLFSDTTVSIKKYDKEGCAIIINKDTLYINDALDLYLSEIERNIDLYNQITLDSAKLSYIEDRYKINVITDTINNGFVIHTDFSKVDSALFLYESYKDMIYQDSTGHWIVTRIK